MHPTNDRMRFIGGSDMAAIMGISPWKTPLDVYLEKIGEGHPEDPEKERIFKRGKRLEPIVIEMLREERGIEVVSVNVRFTDSEHAFLSAEVDFLWRVTKQSLDNFPGVPEKLIDTYQNGEIKTSHPFAGAKFGEEGTDEIPIQYAAQSMHGMGLNGAQICLYGVLIGSDNLSTYVLHRDEETIASMREKAIAFWHNHVLARVPPDPINTDDIMRLFARSNGRPVEATDEIVSALLERERLKSMAKSYEEQIEELQFQICDFVRKQWGSDPNEDKDNAVFTYGGRTIATWNKQKRTTIAACDLQKTHPDVYEQHKKESWFRVLRVKK